MGSEQSVSTNADSAGDDVAPDQVTPSESTESSDSSATDDSSTSNRPRRRVQLNPSIGVEEAKAVPRYQPSPSAAGETSASQPSVPASPPSDDENATSVPETPVTETSPAPAISVEATDAADEHPANGQPTDNTPDSEQVAFETAAATTAPVTTAPVELPPKVDDLDADLEAEIAAALVNESSADAEVSLPPTEDGEETSEETLETGARLQGKVQSIRGDDVFLEIGLRSPGLLSAQQFDAHKKPTVGMQFEVVFDRYDAEEGLVHVNLPKGIRRASGNWDDVSRGQIVECLVSKTNKGGLEVTIGRLRGFLPASQVELGFVSDLETYVGQKLRVKITEAKREKKNLVVSRRAILQMERKEAEAQLWESLEADQVLTGTVKTIKDYGAFVDLGGADGFLHIAEMSWSRLNHPSEVIQEGQKVDVKVLSIDAEKKKISLGMRQLTQNPWHNIEEKFAPGRTLSAKVTRTTNFGAFMELETGVEGLVHISELDHKRVNRVTDVLNVGQVAEVQVLDVDPDRKRIALSVKALQAKPEPEEPEPDQKLVAAAKKRNEPLKGGIGGEGGFGGLFGNPKDFS